jgi:hypothetical protein
MLFFSRIYSYYADISPAIFVGALHFTAVFLKTASVVCTANPGSNIKERRGKYNPELCWMRVQLQKVKKHDYNAVSHNDFIYNI